LIIIDGRRKSQRHSDSGSREEERLVGRAEGKIPHMLVIEDDVSTLELYHEVLQDEGYRVTLATSPDLEPTAVASWDPDLILLDLRFRYHACGLDWLERIKGYPVTRLIQVLVCSADHRLLGRLHDQLLAWDCGVLSKPFGLEEFLAAIHACVAPLVRRAGLDELHAPAGSSNAQEPMPDASGTRRREPNRHAEDRPGLRSRPWATSTGERSALPTNDAIRTWRHGYD
jgi:DNA-binding response OmpR family regulator